MAASETTPVVEDTNNGNSSCSSSISRRDEEDTDVSKKNRPEISAFRQQRLKAWEPILTANTVIPTFALVGLVFIPIGAVLLNSATQVREYHWDYTKCKNSAGELCYEVNVANPGRNCTCRHNFTIDTPISKNVYLYYGLRNFYQNHRRYVKSVDYGQLNGKPTVVSNSCEPFIEAETTYLPYAPCGVIANSMFTDTISLFYQSPGSKSYGSVPVSDTGIAWSTDKMRFKNPEDLTEFDSTAKPPRWRTSVRELPNHFENERFIVWMRTAAFSTFKKLYARIIHEGTFQDGLPKGNYMFEVNYYYSVTEFNGRKEVILMNTSWMGGNNRFLGVVYIVVGTVSLMMAFVFFFVHRKYGKERESLLKFNHNTPYDGVVH